MKNSQLSTTRILAMLSILVLSLATLTTVFATEVTNYTLNTEVKVDGQPITAGKKITTGRILEATNSLTFPDSQNPRLTKDQCWGYFDFGPSKRIGTCY